jgi:hypothetical protein
LASLDSVTPHPFRFLRAIAFPLLLRISYSAQKIDFRGILPVAVSSGVRRRAVSLAQFEASVTALTKNEVAPRFLWF